MVFPVCTGVILLCLCQLLSMIGVPRVYGGDSIIAPYNFVFNTVFPVCAGVIPGPTS